MSASRARATGPALRLAAAAFTGAVCAFVCGCGQTSSVVAPQQPDPAWSQNLRGCLQTAGAKVATSSDDLEFARKDARSLSLATERTLRAGSSDVYELEPEKSSSGNYRIFIKAPNPDNAPSISTANVLAHPHTVPLVAYLREPPVGALQAAESCLGPSS